MRVIIVIAGGLVAVAVLVCLFLLLSGKMLLISEKRDASGLTCRYFTGRSIQQREFYYSENGIMGKSECPFLYVAP